MKPVKKFTPFKAKSLTQTKEKIITLDAYDGKNHYHVQGTGKLPEGTWLPVSLFKRIK